MHNRYNTYDVSKFIKPLLIFIIVFFCAGLFAFAYVGYSTLMMADDYCYFGLARNSSTFINVVLETYTGAVVIAGNRFTSTTLSTLFGYLGAPVVRIIPGLFIAGFFLSIFFLLRQILNLTTNHKHDLECAIAAGLFTGILVFLAPSHFQNLYWFSGIVAYSFPIIFYCLLLGLITKQTLLYQTSLLRRFCTLILAIFTAGFSETSAAAFFILTLILFGLALVLRRIKIKHSLFPTALVGLTIGLSLLILSPSAQARNTGMSELMGNRYGNLIEILAGSLAFGFDFILYQLRGTFLPLTVLFLGMLTIGSFLEKRPGGLKVLFFAFLLVILSAYFSISASMAPQLFAFGAYPNERSQFIPLFILLSGISCLGLLTGNYLSPTIQRYKVVPVLALLLISIYVLRAGILELNYRSQLEPRRQQWLERNSLVLETTARGEWDMIVTGIDSIGTISDFNPICFNDFYHLNSVDVLDD